MSPRKSLRNEFTRSTNEYELKTHGSRSPQSARKNESNGCGAALCSESCIKEMKDNAVQESLNKLFESKMKHSTLCEVKKSPHVLVQFKDNF